MAFSDRDPQSQSLWIARTARHARRTRTDVHTVGTSDWDLNDADVLSIWDLNDADVLSI